MTLPVAGNTTCGRVRWRHTVPVFEWHRMPLTGSRCEKCWLSGRVKKPTCSVIPVFNVAVLEKCCDNCGDGEYYLRSSSSANEDASDREATSGVDRSSMGQLLAERLWKDADFLCTSCNLRGGYGKEL
jgi:hypothetical protein